MSNPFSFIYCVGVDLVKWFQMFALQAPGLNEAQNYQQLLQIPEDSGQGGGGGGGRALGWFFFDPWVFLPFPPFFFFF